MVKHIYIAAIATATLISTIQYDWKSYKHSKLVESCLSSQHLSDNETDLQKHMVVLICNKKANEQLDPKSIENTVDIYNRALIKQGQTV